MSRKKLVKEIFSGAANASTGYTGDTVMSLNSLQKFAATRKRRLSLQTTEKSSDITNMSQKTSTSNRCDSKTPVVSETFWSRFYSLECQLNDALQTIETPSSITHVYNPLNYASNLHCAYLEKFLDGPKRVIFVGMNPGPNGMGQTGVPFGNILTVRNEMGLSGRVQQPPSVHVKRPICGLECTIEEPSGVRIWGLFKKLAGGSLMTFGKNCFVHNFCPLIFYDKAGRNITPSELKGDYKAIIGKLCLDALDKELDLLQPEILVPIGEYINGIIKRSRHVNSLKVYKLHHPSPRALNNQNWPEKAEQLLHKFDLVKYINNEV